jgi:predicted RNA binding protein YcfA (HicA-like mRNA interferase family)
MGRLRVLSGREACRILQQHGFVEVRRRGSHIVMQRRTDAGSITVPIRTARGRRDCLRCLRERSSGHGRYKPINTTGAGVTADARVMRWRRSPVLDYFLGSLLQAPLIQASKPEPTRSKVDGSGTLAAPTLPYCRSSTSIPPEVLLIAILEIPPASLQPKKLSSAVVPKTLPSAIATGPMEHSTVTPSAAKA